MEGHGRESSMLEGWDRVTPCHLCYSFSRWRYLTPSSMEQSLIGSSPIGHQWHHIQSLFLCRWHGNLHQTNRAGLPSSCIYHGGFWAGFGILDQQKQKHGHTDKLLWRGTSIDYWCLWLYYWAFPLSISWSTIVNQQAISIGGTTHCRRNRHMHTYLDM